MHRFYDMTEVIDTCTTCLYMNIRQLLFMQLPVTSLFPLQFFLPKFPKCVKDV